MQVCCVLMQGHRKERTRLKGASGTQQEHDLGWQVMFHRRAYRC